ncbi:MAG TPA: GNAT family N-acetyltransferase [Actinomycetota bacterium]|nr:GNAT family N-acetyltransferase [Actinomycetota bacterium]
MPAHPVPRLTIATTPRHFEIFTELAREYVASLDFPLTFQDFEREIAGAAAEYGPPGGRAWIAFAGDEPAGIVGLRAFAADTAEIKRMFVRPAHRGIGAGRLLAAAAVGGARVLGYRRIVLDSIRAMTAALAIYRSLGFVEIEPYRYNPRPDAVYMALDLSEA